MHQRCNISVAKKKSSIEWEYTPCFKSAFHLVRDRHFFVYPFYVTKSYFQVSPFVLEKSICVNKYLYLAK